jgi:hypothetical protein
MNGNPLREQLLARKAEIEQALFELDRIESLARGDFNQDNEAHASSIPHEKSIAQAVYEELLGKRLTIDQLAKNLRISKQQVHYALTGHRLRKKVRSVKTGGLLRYTIEPEAHKLPNNNRELPALSDAILSLLDSEPLRVWKAKDVVVELKNKVRTRATNFNGAVTSTLSNLAKSGRIEKVKDGYSSKNPKITRG